MYLLATLKNFQRLLYEYIRCISFTFQTLANACNQIALNITSQKIFLCLFLSDKKIKKVQRPKSKLLKLAIEDFCLTH